MKKALSMLMVVGVVVFLAQPLQAQSADEIRAKMIEAQGGQKVLESIKDMAVVASMEVPSMNISGTMTRYQKEPDKVRTDQEFMGMKITQAYDGKTAWFSNPQTGKNEEMSEKIAGYFKTDAYGNEALLNPAKFNIAYNFKEKATVDGRNCLVLEQVFPDGKKTTIFVEATSYLVYKTKSLNLNQLEVETEMEAICSDYRKVGNTMAPFAITVKQGGEVFAKVTVQEITFNNGLEDSFFSMN